MLSNRRRFLQGAASAKVAPVTLQDRSYEPLKLPRPISLAALTILDVSPANQVLCAAKAGYSHVGIRLVPATPTETQYDMIGNTAMIREVEANLKAPASRSSTSKFSASSPTLVPSTGRPSSKPAPASAPLRCSAQATTPTSTA